MDMDWVKIVADLLAGLAVIIPLVAQLVKYIKKAGREANWNQLIALTIDYMQEAEKNISNGADRKVWVMSMVEVGAASIDYELDELAMNKISQMIDDLCKMSKVVNVNAPAA